VNNKFAAICEIWEIFLLSIRRVWIYDESITIDKQLLAYRGRVPGPTYASAIFWFRNGYLYRYVLHKLRISFSSTGKLIISGTVRSHRKEIPISIKRIFMKASLFSIMSMGFF
jgi:hypothetical protein